MTQYQLCSPDQEPARSVLDLHQSAVARTRDVIERVSRRDVGWQLETCKDVTSNLHAALADSPRFLLFACRGGRLHPDPTRKFDMLAFHAVSCAVGMLGCGERAGFSEQDVALGGLAGLVHNLGMALIPDGIFAKRGGLSAEELRQVREHPMTGSRLPPVASETELATIVAQSRERPDGSGYPLGLKGDQIHRLARFVHAVDVFEALTQPRAYRDQQDGYHAIKLVTLAHKGTLWREAARVLVEFHGVYPVGTPVDLNTGEQGKVLEQDSSSVLRPVVVVLRSGSGRPVGPFALRLAEDPRICVRGVIEPDAELRALAAGIC